jgi:hypothetical protein
MKKREEEEEEEKKEEEKRRRKKQQERLEKQAVRIWKKHEEYMQKILVQAKALPKGNDCRIRLEKTIEKSLFGRN